MNKRSIYLGLLYLGISTLSWNADAAPHRVLYNNYGMLHIAEKDGSISWSHKMPGVIRDVHVLKNGNILCCFSIKKEHKGYVREITRKGKVVFEHQVDAECHSVQRLPNGNTLLEDPANFQLLEVTPEGTIAKKLKFTKEITNMHRASSISRKLDNGNYLVVHEGNKLVREYRADGTILKEFKTGSIPYSAERLANGNTLIGAGKERAAYEVDPSGKKVWEYTESDFPKDANVEWIVGAHRLENGNTLIMNWLGHGKKGKGIAIIEVTPDKKTVWSFRNRTTLNFARILD